MMARYGDVFLDSQFEDGSDGTVFKLDIAYVANGTNGGAEGLKVPFPYSHPQPTKDLEYLGDDEEVYRSHLLIRNNRDRDDYSRIIEAAKAISNTSNLVEATADVIDVDQWARTFALQSLTGAADVYTRGGLHHNILFYVRPSDDKLLAFPWDWDFAFTASTSQGLIGTAGTGGRLMNQPSVRRLYYGHLLDIINTTFNNVYLDRWIDHYGEVAGQRLSSIKSYVRARGNFVRGRLPDEIQFEITSNNGMEITTDERSVTLQGNGWIDVREIKRNEATEPLVVEWLNDSTWQAVVPLEAGVNQIALTATNHQGNIVGTDSIQVTSNATPIERRLRVSEINFNPHPPTEAELAIDPSLDNDDFEFVELVNVGANEIDLSAYRFIQTEVNGNVQGIEFDFSAGAISTIGAGQQVLIVEDLGAFQIRYGNGHLVAGQWTGRLSNSSEQLTLIDTDQIVQQFAYRDDWYDAADGRGSTLEIINANSNNLDGWNQKESWKPSEILGGTPGNPAVRPGDSNFDGVFNSSDLVLVFRAGEYEDDIPLNSTFEEGDWNGDGDFTTQDLVLAFQEGGYVAAARWNLPFNPVSIDRVFESDEYIKKLRRTKPANNPVTVVVSHLDGS